GYRKGTLDPLGGGGRQPLRHGQEASPALVDAPLLLGAAATAAELLDACELRCAAEPLGGRRGRLDELASRLPGGAAPAALEVDELGVQPIPRGAPFVLGDQGARLRRHRPFRKGRRQTLAQRRER